jgi:DNA-binding response OmpR family regulator
MIAYSQLGKCTARDAAALFRNQAAQLQRIACDRRTGGAGRNRSDHERVLHVQGDEVFYGDTPLDIPTGKATEVFKVLLSNLGRAATWKALGCEGAEPKQVDDQTKQAKMNIQRALWKAKAPYEIETLRGIGYRLRRKDTRPRKSG